MSIISAPPLTRRLLAGICAAAALAFGADASRAASRVDHTSFITFSGPVAVPGRVLTPGAYVFEIANSLLGGENLLAWHGRRGHGVISSGSEAPGHLPDAAPPDGPYRRLTWANPLQVELAFHDAISQ